MRLANLEGYLKFPGPFPVASIRLKYVARPAAAERFVPREGDVAEPNARAADVSDAGDAADEAVPDGEEIGIPGPGDLAEAGVADAPDLLEMPPEPGSWQGELALIPLPGEAGPQAGAKNSPEGAREETASAEDTPEETAAASASGRREAGPGAGDWY